MSSRCRFHKRLPAEVNDFVKKLELQAIETAEERLPLYLEVGLKSADRVLDVGCGAGFVTRDMALLSNGQVVGIDGSKDLLSVAASVLKTFSNVRLVAGDGLKLPFEDKCFDVVTCNLFLMWVDDPFLAVSEMARVTKKGGVVLASLEPDYGGKIHWPEDDVVDPLFGGEAIRRKGGDPFIGRKLRMFFASAGLKTRIGIGNNRIWSCEEDRDYYLHSRDFYVKVMQEAGLSSEQIDKWEFEFLESLDSGFELNFFPQFYAIGLKQ